MFFSLVPPPTLSTCTGLDPLHRHFSFSQAAAEKCQNSKPPIFFNPPQPGKKMKSLIKPKTIEGRKATLSSTKEVGCPKSSLPPHFQVLVHDSPDQNAKQRRKEARMQMS